MKKKVLLVIEDGSYSFDNRCKHQAKALVANSWQVSVISPKYKNDPYFKKTKEGIYCYYFPKPNAQSAIGHLLEHSISLFFVSVITFWVLIRRGFSVFHACNPMDLLWIIAFPYKIFGKKFIFDQHDLCPELYLSRLEGDENSFIYKILLHLESISYKISDRIIVTNESYKKNALNRGKVAENKIFIVRNGPDIDSFICNSGNKNLKKNGEFLIGYLGNMNKQDGVDNLLYAAQEIVFNRKIKNITFVLIGSGSSHQELVNKTEKMNLNKYISFTGRIPNDEMLNTLNACDICVQPDPFNPLNNYSTMNKVMEYMALKKPVVAFDLIETRVSCQDAALYANPNDLNSFVDNICILYGDKELRQKMGLYGRKRVEEVLAWKYSINNLLNVYNFN